MKLPPGHIPGVGLQQATAYGGLGERLLKQYGWKEGQGLGVQGNGIKSAIKVLKKDDTIGVRSTISGTIAVSTEYAKLLAAQTEASPFQQPETCLAIQILFSC